MPKKNQSKTSETCPNCGYCQHCGQSKQNPIPWYPYTPQYPSPYPWVQPWPQPTWTFTTGGTVTSGTYSTVPDTEFSTNFAIGAG